jgi:hypothetical protein
MDEIVQLDEALALALKLPPKQRIQLIERVAFSIERDIDAVPSSEQASSGNWGENLVRLIEELGPVELIHPEIEDPVEWVKQIRREQDTQRGLDWGKDE